MKIFINTEKKDEFFWFFIYLLIALLLICSCRQDSTQACRELLPGEWYPIEDNTYTDIGIRDYNMTGYRFQEDGLCDYYPGYFEYADPDSGHLFAYPFRNFRYRGRGNWLDNVIRAYGNRTFYQINGDTLSLFNLSSKAWDQRMICFLSPDTLVLSSLDSALHEKYVRKEYILDNQPLFDQLVFYYPHSDFSKVHFFSIHRDGTFVCSYYYTEQDKVITGKLKEGTFEQLETLFKKADFPHLIADADRYQKDKDEYRGFHLSRFPPDSNPYITFISDNRSFTLEDPFQDVSFDNKAFFWAYFYGLFLPQTAQFEPGTLEEQRPFFQHFDGFICEILTKRDSIVDLFHTEKFYLSVLLNQADITDTDFEPIYTLKESCYSKKTMQSDGRYFSYIDKDGKKITLDIGFNYIHKNGLDTLFRRHYDGY